MPETSKTVPSSKWVVFASFWLIETALHVGLGLGTSALLSWGLMTRTSLDQSLASLAITATGLGLIVYMFLYPLLRDWHSWVWYSLGLFGISGAFTQYGGYNTLTVFSRFLVGSALPALISEFLTILISVPVIVFIMPEGVEYDLAFRKRATKERLAMGMSLALGIGLVLLGAVPVDSGARVWLAISGIAFYNAVQCFLLAHWS